MQGAIGAGIQGLQGTQGIQGTSGYVGQDGAQGTQGTSGYVGRDGAQGTQGIQGIGLTGLASAGVVYGSSTNTIQQTNSGTAGQFLMSYGDISNGGPEWISIPIIEEVIATTTTSLTGSWTYSNNTPGTIPSTLTSTASSYTVDGYLFVAGDRVLIKDQTSSSSPTNIANGVYVITQTSPNIILTRDNDADTIAKLGGTIVSVNQGTLFGGQTFVCNNSSTDIMGTTGINFTTQAGYYYGSTAPVNKNSIWVDTTTNPTTVAPVASPTFTGTVTLPIGTSSVPPLILPSGTLMGTPSTGVIESDGTAVYLTQNSQAGRGLIMAPAWVRRNAVGNHTTAYTSLEPIFETGNTTLTLLTNTLYYFRGVILTTTTAAGNSNGAQIGFTFSNTPVSIGYKYVGYIQGTGTAQQTGYSTTATATIVTAQSTSSQVLAIEIEGYFKTNATTGGTMIPGYGQSQSTGATGNQTIAADSWFYCQPISSNPSKTLLSGAWA